MEETKTYTFTIHPGSEPMPIFRIVGVLSPEEKATVEKIQPLFSSSKRYVCLMANPQHPSPYFELSSFLLIESDKKLDEVEDIDILIDLAYEKYVKTKGEISTKEEFTQACVTRGILLEHPREDGSIQLTMNTETHLDDVTGNIYQYTYFLEDVASIVFDQSKHGYFVFLDEEEFGFMEEDEEYAPIFKLLRKERDV